MSTTSVPASWCMACGKMIPLGMILCGGCHESAEKRELGEWAKARKEERERVRAEGDDNGP
ncbi:MAG: hypothetical protein NUW01_14100 [Gemmatimonadaceae bacterium]|nr:hypothetical protein [Gemmatimonadaceae bacterium]